MKVFEYWGTLEPYARFSTADADQDLWSRGLRGEAKSGDWHPIKLHPAEEYPGVPRAAGPMADVTTVNAAVRNCVWGSRARAALEPHVAPFGEFLPLLCKEADWVLFNVTRTIDALHVEQSKITYFKSSGKVMDLEVPVFKPEALQGELIFRLPQRGGGDIFVTDAFETLVKQHGLVGFNLKLVWDSEVAGPG